MSIDYGLIFVLSTYSLRSFVALFWGIFLLFYRRRSLQNIPLSIIFILIGLLYLRNGFLRVPSIEPCDVYNVTSYLILLFIAPFTIFYAYFSIGEKHSTKHRVIHFIPFTVMLALWLVIRRLPAERIPFCYSIEDVLGYWKEYPLYTGYFILLQVIFIVQVLTYFSMALVRFIRLRRLYRFYRYPTRALDKLIAMDYLFLIYPLICVFFMSYNNNVVLGIIHNIAVAIEITAITVLSMHLRLPVRTDFNFAERIIKPVDPDCSAPPPGNGIEAKVQSPQNLLDIEIRKLFEEKEIYRLPQLTLQDIADELNTNRTYVTAGIKRCYGCNFSQLLKQHRTNAAKDLLLNTGKDLQTIMEETGFNTRSSFYNAFREYVSDSLSPTEWRKAVSRKNTSSF